MALIESIQRGSLATTTQLNNITVSAVTIANSYLSVSVKTAGSGRPDIQMKPYLSTTTNLVVDFATAPDANSTIEWQVIEFTSSSGISVQHGLDAAPGGGTDVTISAVTIADSHVHCTGEEGGGDDIWNGGKTMTANITTTTNLNLDNGLGGNSWQVVDWNGHANVEYVAISFGTSDTGTKDTTIGTLTDYTKTMVVGNSRESGDDAEANDDIGPEDVFIQYCTSNTNLRSIRQGGSLQFNNRVHVVEFTDSDIEVQQFQSTIASSGTSTTATLTSVTTANTMVIPGSNVDLLSSSDNTLKTGAVNADYAAVRYVLTNSTTVTMDRTGTGAFNSKMAFSTVEFDVVSAKTATGAITTGAITVSGSGKLGLKGTGAISTPATTVSGSGKLGLKGTGAISIGAITVAGVGVYNRPGTGAITIGPVTVAGSGKLGLKGTGAIDVGAVTVAGVGVVDTSKSGTGAIDVGAITVSGVGVYTRPGTGAITIGATTVSGSGKLGRKGTGSITIGAVTVSGVGVAGTDKTGTGEITTGVVTVSGSGKLGLKGTGSITTPVTTVSGSGKLGRKGTGAISLGVLTVVGVGTVVGTQTGTGAITIGGVSVSGIGSGGGVTSGGSTTKVKKKPSKKKLTEEQIKGMEAFGKARMGITKEAEPEEKTEPEIIEPTIDPDIDITEELESFRPIVEPIEEITPIKPVTEEEVDDDILLILAIIEAHDA